jgi:hypothetical protein
MVMDEKYGSSFSLAPFPHGVSLISIEGSGAQLKVEPCAIILTRYPLHLLPITAHQIAMLGVRGSDEPPTGSSIGACPYGAARTSLALPDLAAELVPMVRLGRVSSYRTFPSELVPMVRLGRASYTDHAGKPCPTFGSDEPRAIAALTNTLF